ncbi:hypothetical protein DWY77_04505 [Megamonas rupellensis]|uniref:HTH cro/C1-type domain-containing protein n=1 Tax=Megamonas rupellensis TaxID=491921 RepID=A0A412CF68_9FIRM|nr:MULTISPECIES: helix-turn-helix domain-containing protein [Megamonas]RGQ84298.1 hypothetical protein DWY77_04505 [Megamonas rupellensis]
MLVKLNKRHFDNAMAKKLFNPTDLAKQAGLSDATIGSIIKDNGFKSYNALGKVAKALDVEPIELIQDEE